LQTQKMGVECDECLGNYWGAVTCARERSSYRSCKLGNDRPCPLFSE
jgi:hypothetical protein